MEFVDWEKIQESIKSLDTPIVTDSPRDCKFFLDNSDITWFGYKEIVDNKIDINDTVAVIMTNWKYYQIIDSLQFWHNPQGSVSEYEFLSEILLSMKNSGFTLMDAYSFFPIHAYIFVRDSTKMQKIPWYFDIKYRDLKIPLYLNGNKIIGFEKN